jgi:hypothetical protein
MKAKTAAFSIICAIALLIFSQCKWGNAEKKQHDFAQLQEFKKLNRVDQVKKCGSCHKAEYDNEMKGPHAHAHTNLEAHINFINGAKYDYADYKTFVNNNNDLCYTCHTSKNIYEGVFAMAGNDFGMNPNGKMEMRNTTERTTGIDCITCHFDGERVVTDGEFKPAENTTNCPSYCSPIASKFFGTNANCQPCHMEQFDDVSALNTSSQAHLTCGGCHDEKNAQGKYTHYTYWAHNPTDKTEPENLDLFNGLSASYLPGDKAVKIVWQNKYMPHRSSACTELVALIEIKDGDKTIKRDTMRLNRRTKHLDDISHKMVFKDFPGITGYEFKTLGDSLVKIIVAPAPSKHSNYSISVTGIKKEQYWLNDSINTVYYKKSTPL